MTNNQPAARGNPADLVADCVQRFLDLARTWLAWDGRPLVSEDGDRVYTPNKAVRWQADHLVDHLAQIEALLAGQPTEPDRWHASLVTVASDWAAFTEADLNEATQRLRRLGQLYVLRFAAAASPSGTAPVTPTGRCARSRSISPSPGTPGRSATCPQSGPDGPARAGPRPSGAR